MQKQQKIALIIGVAMALIAVFMVKAYLDQQRQIIVQDAKKKLEKMQASQVAVLVAKQNISKGTYIEANMVDTAIVPNQYVQPQAVTSLDRISGMMVMSDISKGEQITLTKLAFRQEAATRGSLAMVTPVGKRAITISVDNIAALGGMIKAGDYIDIIGMFSVPAQTPDGKETTQSTVVPLFQNVLVLAVGQEITASTTAAPEMRYKKSEEKKETASALITIALAPQEANLIAFVQDQGKIRLVLRSPADSQIQQTQPASWETLMQYIMPAQPALPAETKESRPQEGAYVEIYRGLNKEKIPLSK